MPSLLDWTSPFPIKKRFLRLSESLIRYCNILRYSSTNSVLRLLLHHQVFLFCNHFVSFPTSSIQVSHFGCKSFALLFDDIDHNMCPADKEVFSSFAHAQVSITNEIYQYLGEPETFLFCPTGT